ncbi:NAD-dependent malic enzyme [Chloroflexales bacterium ZM16-3]|nr:NAD-dependent malic enzyme [Chloroflexales bacterium ZM16-3]
MSTPEPTRPEHDSTTSLRVALRGHQILDTPMLNKGSAFSEEERRELGLIGLLPPHVATMDEQIVRTYANYCQKTDDLERYVFLTGLQDRNEVLFYRLLLAHVAEMMPIVYTPIVGAASQHYSHIYRRPRGLYIAYPDALLIEQMLRNAPHPDVRVIVVTDGERILGLGDLGIGGMGIPIGKLSLYTLCAGIYPSTTLPITLDVGTNNRELLDDPLYLGWRHERVRGSAYRAFIEAFVTAVMRVFPDAILQWEDFAKQNAATLLDRYRDRLCTFNDDIQGTGAVTLAGLMAATDVADVPLREQRIVMLGAGSSVHGICDQIVAAMCADGATPEEARAMIWLVDSRGLVHAGRNDLSDEPFKVTYARPADCTDRWERTESGPVTLAEIVHNVQPGILIGAAAQPGAFDEPLVREMASNVDRPIIFPISNPTSKSEAVPADLLAWTDGRALIATGSPYAPVPFGDRTVTIGQCNNVFIFPGVGLGVLASGARRVTDGMFVAAARALSALSPARKDPAASLYPALEDVRVASRHVALAVGAEAQRAGVADPCEPEDLARRIDELMWEPHYTRLLPV